jgi:hypothetical protein
MEDTTEIADKTQINSTYMVYNGTDIFNNVKISLNPYISKRSQLPG